MHTSVQSYAMSCYTRQFILVCMAMLCQDTKKICSVIHHLCNVMSIAKHHTMHKTLFCYALYTISYALYHALCTVRYALHTLPYAKQKSCPTMRSPTVPPPPPSYVPTVTLTSFTRLFLCIIYTLAVFMHNTESLPEMKYTCSSNIA